MARGNAGVRRQIQNAVGVQAAKALSHSNRWDFISLLVTALLVWLLWRHLTGIIYWSSAGKWIAGIVALALIFFAGFLIGKTDEEAKWWMRLLRTPLMIIGLLVLIFVILTPTFIYGAQMLMWVIVCLAVGWMIAAKLKQTWLYLAMGLASLVFLADFYNTRYSSASKAAPQQTQQAQKQVDFTLPDSDNCVFINADAHRLVADEKVVTIKVSEVEKYGTVQRVGDRWFVVTAGEIHRPNGKVIPNSFYDYKEVKEGDTVDMPDGTVVRMVNGKITTHGGKLIPVEDEKYVNSHGFSSYSCQTPEGFKTQEEGGNILVH